MEHLIERGLWWLVEEKLVFFFGKKSFFNYMTYFLVSQVPTCCFLE